MRLAIFLILNAFALCQCDSIIAQEGDKKEEAEKQVAEHDERVVKVLAGSDLKYDIDDEGDFKFQFEYDDDRSHVVFVNSATQTYQGMEIREVWAVGWVPSGDSKKVTSKVSQNLIRANAELKLGAWQVQTLSGREVAVFRAMIPADADMDTLRNILKLVGVSADEKEMELSKSDDL